MSGDGGLALAIRLIDAGVPVIVVRQVGGKDKLPQGWQTAKADPKALKRYRPGVDALAMVGGHGIDAVDLDCKEGNRGSLSALPKFRYFGVTLTPSGGRHYIVPSTGIGKISPLPGVGDYVGGRADGTGRMIAFLPGSTRAKYPDQPYIEEEPWDIVGVMAADPEEALVAALRAVGGSDGALPTYVDESPERDAEAGKHPYAEAAVRRELERLGDLERLGWDGEPWDNTCFRVACNLVEFGNSGWTGYTVEELHDSYSLLAPVDENFDPEDKWAGALNRVGSGGRRPPDNDQPFGPIPDAALADPGRKPRLPRLNLAELLDPNRPPREWVVDGLIGAGSSVSLVAPAGSMKSLLALGLSLAVARGDETFAGQQVPRQRRVMYCDMENTEDDLAERLVALGMTEDVEELVYLHLPKLPSLDTAAGGAELLRAVEDYSLVRGDLVVLDSAQRVVQGAENDSDTWRAFYNFTGSELKARGLSVLRTDNTGKDVTRGARGSTSKRDDVDTELVMTRDDDVLTIGTGKVRSSATNLQVRVEVSDEGRLSFAPAFAIRSDALERMREKVAAFIADHPGTCQREMREGPGRSEIGGDKNVLQAAINGLVSEKYVEVRQQGTKKCLYLRKPYVPEFE